METARGPPMGVDQVDGGTDRSRRPWGVNTRPGGDSPSFARPVDQPVAEDKMDAELTRLRAALETPFPAQAIQKRDGPGNKKFDYVAHQTVVRRLNEATSGRWDFKVVSLDWRGELLVALVELTIPGMGTRAHIGVQKVSAGGGEDLVKGAVSDGLKKAATLFGVGQDLYGPDMEAEDYTPVQARPAPRSSQPAARPGPIPQSRPRAPEGGATPTPIDSKAPRTEQQAREIQDLIDATSSDAIAISRYYRVGSLGDLTRPQAEHLIATLRSKAQKLAAEA